jgi:hypothetical protein
MLGRRGEEVEAPQAGGEPAAVTEPAAVAEKGSKFEEDDIPF